ncbi:MAG TPA: hypothetical protein VFR70_09890 [Flavobacterium sp.]|nr:hypothetical protein [Flavobacterium sp.]
MSNLNSISLMFMGIGFMVLGFLFGNVYLKIIVLLLAAILNVMAAVRSFREKKESKKEN